MAFKVTGELVQDAIKNGRPVVALETTIYTHGFPYPENLQLATRLEDVVRQNGAVPATIGVLDGVAHVGLQRDSLAQLVKRPHARKISRRDLGFALGSNSCSGQIHGGTTIAGTMILAHLAGIKVFATGGLGGVHRGGQDSLDISADLTELGRTPLAVICSGCKGFLDISRTLEFLETQGVSIATFRDGRNGDVAFPSFWSRDSTVKSPLAVENEAEAAAIIHAHHRLPLCSGMLFANPVPTEHSIAQEHMEDIIKQAIETAEEAGVVGSENTPFILNAIQNLSQGKSVEANRALVESNVRRGARTAVELCSLEQEESNTLPSAVPNSSIDSKAKMSQSEPIEQLSQAATTADVHVMVAGAIAIDTSCNYKPLSGSVDTVTPQLSTSNPAEISQTVGGVAFNVAKAARFRGANVMFSSIVGDDLGSKTAIQAVESHGIAHAIIKLSNLRTPQYVSFNDANKDLHLAMADMSILEQPQVSLSSQWEAHIRSLADFALSTRTPKWLVTDANWDPETLHWWLSSARNLGIPTAFEPVSAAKSTRLFATNFPHHVPPRIVDVSTPNAIELRAMHEAAVRSGLLERQDWWQTIDALGIPSSGARTELVRVTDSALLDEGLPQRSIQLLPFIPNLVMKLGSRGILLTRILRDGDYALRSPDAAPYVVARTKTGNSGVEGLYMRLFPPEEILSADGGNILSTNGAGDTFLGALVAGLAKAREPRIEDFVDLAQRASAMTLKSRESVNPAISLL